MRIIAGVAVALGLAMVAIGVTSVADRVPAAPLVLASGILVARLWRSDAIAPGAEWAGSQMLRVGVALLGAQLSVDAILQYGLGSLAWIALAIGAVFATAITLGRRWGVPPALRILIAAGIAVCGNSAIAAIAPLVRADRAHVAVAVAVITISGMVAVLAYPIIGAALGLSQTQYGVWSGIAIADTGQVLAAALSYGAEATDVATVTKLTRNAFIGPVVMLVAIGSSSLQQSKTGARLPLGTALPPFVVAFLVLAALRSIGLIGEDLASSLASAASFIILVGLAGIGLSTRVGSVTTAGWGPVRLGALLVICLSSVTLFVVLIRG